MFSKILLNSGFETSSDEIISSFTDCYTEDDFKKFVKEKQDLYQNISSVIVNSSWVADSVEDEEPENAKFKYAELTIVNSLVNYKLKLQENRTSCSIEISIFDKISNNSFYKKTFEFKYSKYTKSLLTEVIKFLLENSSAIFDNYLNIQDLAQNF